MTDTTASIPKTTREGGTIHHLDAGAISVPSFTDPAKRYKVHAESRYCSCDRHRFTGRCRKHVVLAEAIAALGPKVCRVVAEENLLEMCKRIYRPLRAEHPIDSYHLFLETAAYRHASKEMVRDAMKRHRRVLALDERRAA
jgi:hypothetical protein